jgi:uncharacterized membrane protein
MDGEQDKTNSEPQQAAFDPADIEKSKVVSALAYLGILFFLPLVVYPDSKFGRFHANQGLVLLIFDVIGSAIFYIIPLPMHILGMIYSVLIFVLFIIGLINALNGQAKPLPVIGGITLLK